MVDKLLPVPQLVFSPDFWSINNVDSYQQKPATSCPVAQKILYEVVCLALRNLKFEVVCVFFILFFFLKKVRFREIFPFSSKVSPSFLENLFPPHCATWKR